MYRLCILIFAGIVSAAQFSGAGMLHAADLQVVSDHGISVISEPGDAAQAQQVLTDLSQILPAYRDMLLVSHRFSWPVVISSDSSSPSGFVSLPVVRSVWESVPYSSLSSGADWFRTLALHEGRHMVQYEALDTGLTRFADVIGGRQMMMAMTHSFIPGWIYEGDATIAETRFSREGRGRSAAFIRSLRALLIEHPQLSFRELSQGSYVHGYPDMYAYGYVMMGYLLERYGDEGIAGFFRTLGAYPVPFLSPTIAISSLMGSLTTPSALFELVKADLLLQWDQQMQGRIITPRESVAVPELYGAVRIEAYAVTDSTIAVVTHDRSQGLQLREYALEDGSTVSGSRRVPASDVVIGDEYLLWIEHRPKRSDPGSTIDVLVRADTEAWVMEDLAAGVFTGSPVLSADGKSVAVSTYDPQMGSSVQVFDVHTGLPGPTIHPEHRVFIGDMVWDEETLIVVEEQSEGRYLTQYTLQGEAQRLFFAGHHQISGLARSGPLIYYGSDVDGIDEIYQYDTRSGEHAQVTVSRYGLWDPVVVDGQLYAVELDSFDREILVRVYTDAQVLPVRRSYDALQVDRFLDPERFAVAAEPASGVEVLPYRRIDWVFTPYARGILLPETFSELTLGFKCADPLLEHETSLSIGYDLVEKEPVFHTSWTRTGDLLVSTLSLDLAPGDGQLLGYTAAADLSLNTRVRHHGRALDHSLGGRVQVSDALLPGDFATAGVYDLISFGLQAAERSLVPYEPGITHEISAFTALGSGYPVQINDLITLYTGALLRDDGFILRHRIRWRSAESIPWPAIQARGYTYRELPDEPGASLLGTVSARYLVPLGYPDLSVARTFFIKRIRAELFFDHTYWEAGTFSSAGIELLADMTFAHLYALELSSGIRASYRLEDQRFAWELILFSIPIPL
jgi:hypothetical protein